MDGCASFTEFNSVSKKMPMSFRMQGTFGRVVRTEDFCCGNLNKRRHLAEKEAHYHQLKLTSMLNTNERLIYTAAEKQTQEERLMPSHGSPRKTTSTLLLTSHQRKQDSSCRSKW